jgi:tRNA (cmo5U34)-methyltransferase
MSTTAFETAEDYWGSQVHSYDSLIRRIVPPYEEITRVLVAHLPERAARVVELGAGTGNLSLALAARYPDASLVLVDAAKEMLDVTRSRIAHAHPNVAARADYRLSRFEDLSMPPASVDAVASQMSVHHVVDKSALFERLAEMLAPGGALVFADRLRSATDAAQSENWDRWVSLCRRTCTPTEVEGLLRHAADHDHYATVAEHFAAMQRAGFVGVDCVWRDWAWGVFTAERGTLDCRNSGTAASPG